MITHFDADQFLTIIIISLDKQSSLYCLDTNQFWTKSFDVPAQAFDTFQLDDNALTDILAFECFYAGEIWSFVAVNIFELPGPATN